MFSHTVAIQQFGVITLIDHRIAAARKGITLSVGMEKIDNTTLAVHDVEIQILAKAFPKFQRMAVKL